MPFNRMEGEVAKRNLYEAAKAGEVATFNQLLEQDPYLLDVASRDILHIATMHGQERIVEEITRRHPKFARDLDTQTSSPLHIAAAEGYVEIVAKLVRVAPEMRWWRDGQGMNPVHVAAMNGHVEVLKELLHLDSSPAMERLQRGQTVLHLCVKHHHIGSLEVLEKKLGDLVNAKDDDGETILHLAARCNDVEAAVSPPGGVWQEDTSSHRAGEAVMASTCPKIYKHFVRANTTAFLSSLLTIFLITTRQPSENFIFLSIALYATWVSLASFTVSYGASVVVLTPNAETTKSLQPILVKVVAGCLGILTLAYI